MQITSLFKTLSLKRIVKHSSLQFQQICTTGFPLHVKTSGPVMAEPLKAKKKIDPAIIKAREERKKRKVEKMIRKRLKLDRQLKPVYENETPECLILNSQERKRKIQIPEKNLEDRLKLLKQWSQVKFINAKADMILISQLLKAQKIALDELRIESEELYQAAVKVDKKLIPFEYIGPTETPCLKSYTTPDGEYLDISKKWQ